MGSKREMAEKIVDERFQPGSSRITEIESFHRYQVASELCRGRRVLDAACGEGYGTAMLARSAASAVGVDLSEEAVKAASAKYAANNLSYVVGDVLALPFADASFDCVVSFETIEHVTDPRRFVAEIRRVLKPSGLLVLSSPNRRAFDRRNRCENGGNPYHLHEMEQDELLSLVREFFPQVAVHAQDAFYNSVIGGEKLPGRFFVKNAAGDVLTHETLRTPQYSIVLATDVGTLPTLQPSSYLDATFDADDGYCWDDESVPNQFGLRGELERLQDTCGKLKATVAAGEAELAEERMSLAARDAALAEGKSQVERLQLTIAENAVALAEGRKTLAAQDEMLAERTAQIERLQLTVGENEVALSEKDTALAEKETALAEKEAAIAEKDVALAEKDAALARSEGDRRELRLVLESCKRELNARCRDLAVARDRVRETRTEIARAQGETEAVRTELSALQREKGELDLRLAAATRAAEGLNVQLKSANEKSEAMAREAASRKTELDEAKTRFEQEHAKAEYLYYLLEEMKKSWSWRLVGKRRLRKRAGDWFRRLVACLHRAGKVVFLRLPMSFVTRRRIKDVLYSRFGWLLKDVKGYQDWIQLNRLIEELMVSEDTGLIVPGDVPLTSIVIPVYNNLALTRVCIQSIYDNRGKSPFEIIVVDDCSTEDIGALQREFPDVRVVRNERNSGFLLTANRGGREARGEYVVFLNNDTSVLPGWLDELTTALYGHPEAGMIGSQLIHMGTRRLQESGNLICKDGRMLPLGRGEDPNHPEFTYFREVDFCSAASIILRKSVFDEMRGFDTAYAPAYFEDPDLALRLQKAGYRNYVMPLSRVMHQEMASYGATLSERCERNRKFFVDRWKDYLAEHSLYDTPEAMSAERKFPRPRVLYIDAEVPMADRGSGGMDAIYFMEYFLRRGYEVVFHGEYTPGFVPKYTSILLRMGVECVYAPQRQIWEYIASNGWTFSLVFVSRIYQARCFDRLLKRHCPQAAYVFNTVDVHFVREQLEAELRKDENLRRLAADTKRYELQVAGAADATIVISKDEKRLLTDEYGLGNVWHVPQMREVRGRAENTNRSGAVFIGSAHPPNMDGLKYFHDEILPLLPKDFKLTVVGGALKKVMGEMQEYSALLACPQFEFVGFVQELGDVLDTALMTVAPLRYGAGTKGKVASSMSYGVPCVSSRFGTEGTGMEDGENILIASTPEEFAAGIRRLSEDAALWQKISDGGIRFLRDNYSRATVDGIMDRMLATVDACRKSSSWVRTPILPKVDD